MVVVVNSDIHEAEISKLFKFIVHSFTSIKLDEIAILAISKLFKFIVHSNYRKNN